MIHRLLEHGVFFAGYGPTVYPTRHSAPDHLTLPGQQYALVRVPPLGSVLCANFREHPFHSLECIGQEPGPESYKDSALAPASRAARSNSLEGDHLVALGDQLC